MSILGTMTSTDQWSYADWSTYRFHVCFETYIE